MYLRSKVKSERNTSHQIVLYMGFNERGTKKKGKEQSNVAA